MGFLFIFPSDEKWFYLEALSETCGSVGQPCDPDDSASPGNALHRLLPDVAARAKETHA
jgi:hypothetical protein